MQVLGRHALLDLYDCDSALLDDLTFLREVFLETCRTMKCTLVKECFHRYAPQGVSGVLVIAESHLSIHTWPEHRYAAIDLFTCGDPSELARMPALLGAALKSSRSEFRVVDRGLVPAAAMPPVTA